MRGGYEGRRGRVDVLFGLDRGCLSLTHVAPSDGSLLAEGLLTVFDPLTCLQVVVILSP